MEISSFRNLAELGMDDPVFFQQWPDKSLEQLNYASSMASATSGDFHHPFSQQPVLDSKRAHESYQLAGHDRPLKQLKPDIWNPVETVKPKEEAWSLNLPPVFESQNHVTRPCQLDKRINNTSTRDSQAQDHILAERKRREKLSQRLIALSALVPGLKKMDKASVLGDAIKHMKHLQEKVKILEEQTKKRSIESVVFVKKYELLLPENDQNSSQSDASFSTSAEPLPQVEARFCGKDVLITIHCERGKGMFEKAVAEIEKLNLSIVNSCVMTYGDSALNITVIAQKDEGYKMNMEELVDNLRSAVKILM